MTLCSTCSASLRPRSHPAWPAAAAPPSEPDGSNFILQRPVGGGASGREWGQAESLADSGRPWAEPPSSQHIREPPSEVMLQLADLSRECGVRGPSQHPLGFNLSAALKVRGHTLSSVQVGVCAQPYPEPSPPLTGRALLRKGVASPHLPYKGLEGLLLLRIGLLEDREAEGHRESLGRQWPLCAEPASTEAGAQDIFCGDRGEQREDEAVASLEPHPRPCSHLSRDTFVHIRPQKWECPFHTSPEA